jgi:hypothetical protein
LKLLLKDPRSDPTVADNAMIRRAVNNDREDLVQLLLKHPRTDPLGPGGYEGMTTIDIAVERMNLKMLQLILADPRVDFSSLVRLRNPQIRHGVLFLKQLMLCSKTLV